MASSCTPTRAGPSSTPTTTALFNGVPGKIFHCIRGVRQRDPLSPLLFILGADLLQCVMNEVRAVGQLNSPIPVNYTRDFPILQYVDDTLIIMQGCPTQLLHLKATILEEYSSSTGLKVNYSKSMMMPINMTEERCNFLSQTFGCSVEKLPFTYLALPL